MYVSTCISIYFRIFSTSSRTKLTAILSWYKEHGITSRKKSHEANTLRLEMADIREFWPSDKSCWRVCSALPVRVPGFLRMDIKLLPLSDTKMSVWWKYVTAMASTGTDFILCKSYFWCTLHCAFMPPSLLVGWGHYSMFVHLLVYACIWTLLQCTPLKCIGSGLPRRYAHKRSMQMAECSGRHPLQ